VQDLFALALFLCYHMVVIIGPSNEAGAKNRGLKEFFGAQQLSFPEDATVVFPVPKSSEFYGIVLTYCNTLAISDQMCTS